ncbi:hypothetical protein GCM10022236_42090 [Microlunatus ginsengisoli]|uniref:PH domain-containing protein n=1 Tax=Microlunatus ginsengisoli TaxID=363863 RepID=A0ABP7ALX9_9ACTN
MHPFYFVAVGFFVLWTLLGVVWLVAGFEESGWTWSLLLFLAWSLMGPAWIAGPHWVCSVAADSTGIVRRKGEEPRHLRWDEISSIRVGVSDDSFALIELPILDELLAARARRFEPVITCGSSPYLERTVHLWELGRFSGRRGLARMCRTVDVLRARAGLEAAEHPSLAELREELKELAWDTASPRSDYKPRRAKTE